MKKPALQKKQVAGLRLAFRARKVFGTFETYTSPGIELEFGNVCFWGEGKTGVPGEKPLGARKTTNNKLNPHIASSPKIDPEPHRWEASALSTAPCIPAPHPHVSSVYEQKPMQIDSCYSNEFTFYRGFSGPLIPTDKRSFTVLSFFAFVAVFIGSFINQSIH